MFVALAVWPGGEKHTNVNDIGYTLTFLFWRTGSVVNKKV